MQMMSFQTLGQIEPFCSVVIGRPPASSLTPGSQLKLEHIVAVKGSPVAASVTQPPVGVQALYRWTAME